MALWSNLRASENWVSSWNKVFPLFDEVPFAWSSLEAETRERPLGASRSQGGWLSTGRKPTSK